MKNRRKRKATKIIFLFKIIFNLGEIEWDEVIPEPASNLSLVLKNFPNLSRICLSQNFPIRGCAVPDLIIIPDDKKNDNIFYPMFDCWWDKKNYIIIYLIFNQTRDKISDRLYYLSSSLYSFHIPDKIW